MIPHKQLSLADIFSNRQNIFDYDKPAFLSLLENHIDLDEIIPASFYSHFYASTGRVRKYPLKAMLWALIIQRIFSVPTDQLLLTFLNYDFMASHPETVTEKKSDSPDEDKSVHDARLLIPTLQDFFQKHPLINPKAFFGDAAFDAVLLYKDLLSGDTFGTNRHFSKAYIPLNSRAHLENTDYTVNEDGVPCCPKDASFPMKYEGNCEKYISSALMHEKSCISFSSSVFLPCCVPFT